MDHVTHLGLDVHKDTIAVAILRPDQNVPDERVIANTLEALRNLVGHRRGSVVAYYEAVRPTTKRTGSGGPPAIPATSSLPPSSLAARGCE